MTTPNTKGSGTSKMRDKVTSNAAAKAALDAKQIQAGVSVIVHEDGAIGPYSAGDTLTLQKNVADFFRQHGNDPRLDSVKDAQIVEVIKAKHSELASVVPPMANEDVNIALLDAVMNAPFMAADMSEIPATTLPPPGSLGAIARKYGEAMDVETCAALTKGVEGKKDDDASPIVTLYNLKRQFSGTEFLSDLPQMHTRLTGSKHDKVPYGFSVPQRKDVGNGTNGPLGVALPDYNGPAQHYKWTDRTTMQEHSSNVVAEMVSTMQGDGNGKYWFDRLNQLRALTGNKQAIAAGTPDELIALKGDVETLQSMLASASFEFQRRVNRVTAAITLWQKEVACKEWFNDRIQIELFDPIPALNADGSNTAAVNAAKTEAARKRKPLCFVTYTYVDVNGERMRDRARSIPVMLSKVLNLEFKKYDRKIPNAAPMLVQKRGTTKGAEGNKTQPGALAPEITSTTKAEEYCSALANYLNKDGTYAFMMQQIRKPDDGGQLASAVRMAYAKLKEIADNDDVKRLADMYEENATQQQADKVAPVVKKDAA